MGLNKKKKAKALVALCICLFSLSTTSICVNATGDDEYERGNLRINSHVISDTREEITNQASIGFEVAPSLFLENMAEREALRVQADDDRLEEVRTTVFKTEVVADRLNTSEIVTMLFQEIEDVSGVLPIETTYNLYFETPTWLWVLIGIVSTTVLGYVGVMIGPKVSHLIHKNEILSKEGEVNE